MTPLEWSTLALVFVTLWYAYLTYKILKETQKDRRVEFISRQLEKLYYPIKDNLKNESQLPSILWYRYLADEKFRKQLEIFYKNYFQDPTGETTREAFNEIKKNIDSEIYRLHRKLDESLKLEELPLGKIRRWLKN